jgi:hypothetical protein
VNRFDRALAIACLGILCISVAGCWLTGIHTAVAGRLTAVLMLSAMVAPLPAYWHQKGAAGHRDAALTIFWAVLLAAVLSFPLLIAARLRMPMQDLRFSVIDGWFGIHIAAIHAWAVAHLAGRIISGAYPLLTPLLAIAIFAPALAGRVRVAREFLLANIIAFAIAAPLFALLPAIGPWSHGGFAASPDQSFCQASLMALRLPGPYLFSSQGAGVVCFPSFHVIWALLCARALWTFRSLRIPATLLSAVIVLSTMTTGWHYFSDVLAGILIAAASIALAHRLVRDPIAAHRA